MRWRSCGLIAGPALTASTSARRAEAEIRAETLLEAVRAAPPLAMLCLVGTEAGQWGRCEAACGARPCRFTLPVGVYGVVPERTHVTVAGAHGRVRDIAIAIAVGSGARAEPVVVRSAVFQ